MKSNSLCYSKMIETKLSFGLSLSDDAKILAELLEPRKGSLHLLVTDDTVNKIIGQRFIAAIREEGLNVDQYVIHPGEQSKSIDAYCGILESIFSRGIDRESVVISLGGGVVANLAGFLAATVYRGIGLIHIPTTLMAQVDASIDFRQAINSSYGKNLIGSIYPPEAIIIDPAMLESLGSREIFNGMAEVIKHAITQAPDFLEFLLSYDGDFFCMEFLSEVVHRTVALKASTVNDNSCTDISEMLPQYGHAIGHAVEHLSGYNMLHGEAISVGMCVTSEIASILDICDMDCVDLHYYSCEKFNLPTIVPESIEINRILAALTHDKHFRRGTSWMSFLESPGTLYSRSDRYGVPVESTVIGEAIEANRARRSRRNGSSNRHRRQQRNRLFD